CLPLHATHQHPGRSCRVAWQNLFARAFLRWSQVAQQPFPGNCERPMPDRLTTDIIDAELAPGARNAIRVCLRLQPTERITIITDEATTEIAAALQAEVEEVG